jgi:hypothetical protein
MEHGQPMRCGIVHDERPIDVTLYDCNIPLLPAKTQRKSYHCPNGVQKPLRPLHPRALSQVRAVLTGRKILSLSLTGIRARGLLKIAASDQTGSSVAAIRRAMKKVYDL